MVLKLDNLVELREFSGQAFNEAKEKTGSDWDITIIKAGLSENGRFYPVEVLREALPLFEGKPMYAATGKDHNAEERGLLSTVGFVHEVRWDESTQSIKGVAHISDPDLRASLLDWDKHDMLDQLAGISMASFGKYGLTQRNGVRMVESIRVVASVDIVQRAAAGGSFDQVLESEGEDDMPELTAEQIAEIQEALKGTLATTLEEAIDAKLSPVIKELEEIKEMAPGEKKPNMKECGMCAAEAEEMRDMPGGKMVCEGCAGKMMEMGMMHKPPTMTEAQEELQSLRREQRNYRRDVMLSESKMPEAAVDRIRKTFGDDSDYEISSITEAIQAEKDYLAAQETALKESLEAENRERLGTGVVMIDESDKRLARLDAMFSMTGEVEIETGTGGKQKVKSPASLVEAYIDWNGYKPIAGQYPHTAPGREYIIQKFLEGMTYDSSSPEMREGAMYEALTTTDWAQVASDRMYKALIDNYNMFPQYQNWRKICTKIDANDFKAQRRIKTGGYSDLVVVSEGAAYQDFADPNDEETTVTVQRLGGIVRRITRELLFNDDVGAVRRIPRDLGLAAARTLHKAIFLTILEDNATYGADSTALFHNNHSNLTTGALNGSTLNSAEVAMRKQRRYNDPRSRQDLGRSSAMNVDDVLGAENQPSILIVPTSNKGVAARLVNPSDQIRLNITGGSSKDSSISDDVVRFDYLEPIVVDELTEGGTKKTQGILVANPMMVEGIVVSFLSGREEPDIVIQSDPHYGDPFAYDAMSIRVRHEWGAALTDYRPLHKIMAA